MRCLKVCLIVSVIAFWAGYFVGKPKPKPKTISPAFVVETIPRTDTTIIVKKMRDSGAERELQKLRAQLAERQGVISRLTTEVRSMEVRMRFMTDSITCAELGRYGGMLMASFDRGRVQAWGVRDGVLTQWCGSVDKNRWRVWVGEGGVKIQQSRFPPVGVVVYSRFSAPYDTLVLRMPVVGVGAYITTKPFTWRLGVSSRREIEVGVETGFEF